MAHLTPPPSPTRPRSLCRLLATMAALLAGAVLLPAHPADAAVGLPGGRSNYVVSLFGGTNNAHWVRAAQYTFTASGGSVGTVTERFWYWNQATFTGNATTNKVLTGYKTSGCQYTCPIKAPLGFEPGAASKTLSGSYYFDIYGRLVITWPGGQIEAWSVANQSTYTRLTIHHSNYGVQYGDGWGSKASFSAGATRDTVKSLSSTGTERSNAYNSATTVKPQNFYFPGDYQACASSPCLFSHDVGPARWRSALVFDPAANGRKVLWQSQFYGVDNYTGDCFSPGGGHTWALLQAVDDNGVFLGFTGVEASLHARAYGNAVVSQLFETRVGLA